MDKTAAASVTAETMQLPAVDSGTTILTTLGWLCLLLGVIYLAYYLMKRFGLHGVMGPSGADGPHLVSRLMVGNRQSVAVVRYKDKDLLLGVTDNNISVLTETDADESEVAPATKSFASFLKRSSDDEA